MQLGFFVNLQRCLGCHTCEVACQETYDLSAGLRRRRVRTLEGGAYPHPWAYAVSLACNHCRDPICMKVCPAGAYTKRAADGLVIHDASRCIGCQYCTYACPYGAPQYDAAAGRATKCSGCHELVGAGQQPVCVEACPVRALEFGPLDGLDRRHPDAVVTVPALPDAGLTGPSLRLQTRLETLSRPTRLNDGHRRRHL